MNCFIVLDKSSLCWCLIWTFSAKILYPIMHGPFMLAKTILWSCFVLTGPAGKFPILMIGFFVVAKTPFCWHLIKTFFTNILYSFMNHSLMFQKFCLWRCFVLTFFTTLFQSFMNCSFVLYKISLCCCLINTFITWVLYHSSSCFINSLIRKAQ